MAQKRIGVVRQGILGNQLRLLYDDGTQDVLECGGVAFHSKIPINVQPESSAGLALEQTKMKLGIKS